MNNQQTLFNFLTANRHAIKNHPDQELIKKFTDVCNGLSRKLDAIQEKVDKQAEDEGLWFIAEHCSEGYLQEALRELHKVIENGE
ncbi:hypothetical protein KAR91_46395 [Candidatus Pacearchaeota archaeon]|nr:hypothetical protein [Candidatus Pacearchaeota archaeon]